MSSSRSRGSLLARHEKRPLFLVMPPSVDAPIAWPVEGKGFSLLIQLGGPGRPESEALLAIAGSAIAAGARWVVCRGPWAAELEDAFIDAQLDPVTSEPDEDTVATGIEAGPLDEALWEAWHLFADQSPPVVALFLQGDPAIKELRSMARNLKATFQRVLDREDAT